MERIKTMKKLVNEDQTRSEKKLGEKFKVEPKLFYRCVDGKLKSRECVTNVKVEDKYM